MYNDAFQHIPKRKCYKVIYWDIVVNDVDGMGMCQIDCV